MFTGLVTDIGQVIDLGGEQGGLRLRIASRYEADTITNGASIACSGICLTVIACGELEDAPEGGYRSWFDVEAWKEALRLTTAGAWNIGSPVNLERAMRAGDELGGHIVSGHVDGQAEVITVTDEGAARRFQIKAPDGLARFIAAKGSVCLDGVSLTVNAIRGSVFDVLLIRHSLNVTCWGQRRAGDRINIEIDPLARYIARLIDCDANFGQG